MIEPIAWPALMRLGLKHLGLTPQAFWALTPAELIVMAGLENQTRGAMTRAAFQALAERYPDKEGMDHADG